MSSSADTVTITSIDESESTHNNIPPASSTSSLPLVELEPNLLKTEATMSSPAGSISQTTTPVIDEGLSSPSGPQPSTSSGSSASASLDDPVAIAGSSKDTPTTETEEEKKEGDSAAYECNICLDTAKDAVVSMCGHLFCWPCLHQWLETRPRRQLCPVCKAAVSKDKVIPLYGRGSTNQQDPRTKVPPRPAGQRTEPEPGGFQGFGLMDGGFHMSFGIGAFPLGYLSSSFNFDGRGRNRGELT